MPAWSHIHDGYHLNHAGHVPHLAPGEREAQRRASNRTWNALMLAPNPDTWLALVKGEAVPTDQLDQNELARRRRRRA